MVSSDNPLAATKRQAVKLGLKTSSLGIQTVTEGQVQKAIAKAKKSSAVDLNGISPEMLKLSGEKIIPQLTHVINMSIRESKVPGC
jgi:hypothetical protein